MIKEPQKILGATALIICFTLSSSLNFGQCGDSITYAGQTYNTVKIGDQCWMKENLNVGEMIEIDNYSSFSQRYNSVIEKYCYDNDPDNCETYGGLYEWPEAMQYSREAMGNSRTDGVQGICPSGWHIPTKAEFWKLIEFVNSQAAALIDESETLLYSPAIKQNESGFSALRMRVSASFWSSSAYDSTSAYALVLNDYIKPVGLGVNDYQDSASLRCLRDSIE